VDLSFTKVVTIAAIAIITIIIVVTITKEAIAICTSYCCTQYHSFACNSTMSGH